MSPDAQVRHLRGIDAYHLYEETPRRPTHTVKVLRLEPSIPGQELGLDELRDHFRHRLTHLPLLRSVFVPVPGHLYHPAVVDLGMPDLRIHVQDVSHVTSDAKRPENVAAKLASSPLPRDRPLWRASLGTHPEGDSQAIFLELGHTLADGQASARLLEDLFGHADEGSDNAAGAEPKPAVPSRMTLARSGGRSLARLLARSPAYVGRSVHGGRTAASEEEAAAAVRPFASPRVPWGGPLERGRDVAYVSLRLEEIHATRATFGATVGDMVLAYVGRATESHLRSEGHPLRRSLTAVVPIGPRERTDTATGNRHHHTFAPLATDVGDLAERVRRISVAMRRNVARTTEAALDAWESQLEYYPLFRALYLASVVPMGRLLSRPPASMIVSTVRGPQSELSVGPMRVSHVHSIGVLTEHLGLNVTAWSYLDELNISVLTMHRDESRAIDIAARIKTAVREFAESARAVQADVAT